MKRLLAVMLAATGILAGTVGTASATPWVTWKANYIQAHNLHIPVVPATEDLTPAVKTLIADVRHREHVIWVKYQAHVDAWRAKMAAARAARAAKVQHVSSTPSGSGYSGGYGDCSHGYIHDAIVAKFSPIGSVSHALYVANRESHCNPYAKNRYSSAAGVFQFVSSTWAIMSARAGYGGASVYNGYANVAVAAWTVAHYGWGAWGG
jgi:hypothetical protein